MQDAIILYENGKAIGGEGHPTDASDITFDNAGTDLVSEEVESAIKEVNEKTKHGVVELWLNSSPSSDYAGQSFSFQSDKTFDSFLVEYRNTKSVDSTMISMCENGGGAQCNTSDISTGKCRSFLRNITISQSGSTISVTVTDCSYSILNSYGTTPTTTTANSEIIPVRILGILHND